MKLRPGTALSIKLLNDEGKPATPVGRLAFADGVAQLEWSREALAAGLPLSPMRYPLESGLYPARTLVFDGLRGFLADSLPDAWGTVLLRRQLTKLGHRFEDLNVVDRLALVGRRGRGALVFEPETLPDAAVSAIDLDRLADEAQHVLLGEADELGDQLTRLGGGSGGARPKVHLAIADDGKLMAGDDLEGRKGSEWIVKFAAPGDPADIGPIEEAYARMARAAGIDMAETKLIATKGEGSYFATRRFDRPALGKRLHMVSLGGAVEASPHMPSLDYDGFLRATLSITRDMRDVEQAFRRMVFNVLAHNRDDHVRQHAFLMNNQSEWRLAPAFDLTFSHGPGGEHYMAVMGEGRDITRAHIQTLGIKHGIATRTIAGIIDAVRASLTDWAAIAKETGVARSLSEIENSLKTVERGFAAAG